ncbi:MAG: hypothetical protein H7Y36_08015 [Armatimonadetes bacterium]|nr:hypothetical protein [Akkermansiaceae bacterium]
MKPIFLTLLILVFPLDAEVPRNGVVFRDAATNEKLMEEYRKVRLVDPMKAAFPESKGEDPSVVNRVGNLLENSDVISFNGQTTLVPKNALVFIPAKFSDRINKHPQGAEVVGWLDFFSHNQGWISTVEVSFAQARGDEPVDPEVLQLKGKSGNLIVAVLKSGPISVMPPKTEKTENSIQTASQDPKP